ncbi:hypothetical protein ISS30_09510 [bacterium]|nr:hypothetical protein [FCB group bacterium]MBL7191921.1 hypothetical protein [bacterium]
MKNNYFDYLSIKPITGSIPPRKQEAKRHYGVHPYFTRRSYNVVQEYIRNFTKPGDLVVDPFGGSGVTAIEALVLRRKAIHIDINPLANFITKCVAVSPVDLDALEKGFRKIEKECKIYIEQLYKFSDKEIESLNIEGYYPKEVILPKNADKHYLQDIFSPRQLRALAKLKSIITEINDEIVRELLFFVFSATIQKCNLTVTQTERNGKKAGGPISSILKVARYWMPKNPVELNPWEQFSEKYRKLIIAKKETNLEINNYFSSENIKIIKGDAYNLHNIIESETVDYVYTDPPYGAHINYLDLSTIWNAWLGFKIEDKDREAEIIEGGDLKKTKEDYIERLSNSIYEIFRILKFERWFSLVFAHKDPLYWDTIIKAAASCGFEYSNTSTVKAGIVSYHKHKNPLTVISGELVINFIKKRSPRALAVTKVGIKTVDFVLNSAELSIAQRENYASTEEIYADLIPKLIETGLLSDLKDKISDITPLLSDRFDFNFKIGKWFIPPNTKLGGFIPLDVRIRFYIESYLNQCARKDIKASLDMIWENVMPLLKNGDQPSRQELIWELHKIAESYEKQYYQLKKEIQRELFKEKEIYKQSTKKDILPEWNVTDYDHIEHNEMIYRLGLLGKVFKLQNYIGLNERSRGTETERLNELSLNKLPRIKGLTKYNKNKIEQIDIIWFDYAGFPLYAFEIEKTTTITSAIERFAELCKMMTTILGKMIIVCPASRKSKIDAIFLESVYMGHPLYLENKIKYLYFEDIVEIYNNVRSDNIPSIETFTVELRKRLKMPE